ncbi:tetratricopeptide repeat protein [Roseateles sp. BYS180W]|uniref:Tetratricopeptide repeat protein n=1 Tax=Roseateles rivi TaxID=3299028 RepID=A0ABW7FXA5_9BURK
MTSPRRLRWPQRVVFAALTPLLAAGSALAAVESSELKNSRLDAPMFYQLLLGELELNAGQPGTAYQLLLDAARRTSDEALFQRVVQIALQERAGDQAVIAARAWRDARPESTEAHRTLLQLLSALNRHSDIPAAFKALLAASPASQRAGMILSLPSLFTRSADGKQALELMQPLLRDAQGQADTRLAALSTEARLALGAQRPDQALALTRNIVNEYPQRDEGLQLALELLPQRAEAEALIQNALRQNPARSDLRLAYGRALGRAQRSADAVVQLRQVTEQQPRQAAAWMALAALELDLQHASAAEAALQQLQTLLDRPEGAEDLGEATLPDVRRQLLLMRAQAAEQRGNFAQAEQQLAAVQDSEPSADLIYRRASLAARQGQLERGLSLIRELPQRSAQEQRTRLLAEVQLLREQRQWQAAYQLLDQAVQQQPKDVDLLYEQAMMAEKIDRLDDMERQLRRVIELKPDHHHAYNALGYSLAERGLRLNEARELIVKALSFSPREPFIVDSLGWVEFRLGRLKEAETLLRQAYSSRPDPEIAAHLGEVLWVQQRQDEARAIWDEGLKRDPSNEALRATLKRLGAMP